MAETKDEKAERKADEHEAKADEKARQADEKEAKADAKSTRPSLNEDLVQYGAAGAAKIAFDAYEKSLRGPEARVWMNITTSEQTAWEAALGAVIAV